jgi:hypothetical protein
MHACLRGKVGDSGGHRSPTFAAVLYTKCTNIINKGVMSLFRAIICSVTAAGRPLDPAAVHRWYRGGAYSTPLAIPPGTAAYFVIVIDIRKLFCARPRVLRTGNIPTFRPPLVTAAVAPESSKMPHGTTQRSSQHLLKLPNTYLAKRSDEKI